MCGSKRDFFLRARNIQERDPPFHLLICTWIRKPAKNMCTERENDKTALDSTVFRKLNHRKVKSFCGLNSYKRQGNSWLRWLERERVRGKERVCEEDMQQHNRFRAVNHSPLTPPLMALQPVPVSLKGPRTVCFCRGRERLTNEADAFSQWQPKLAKIGLNRDSLDLYSQQFSQRPKWLL